MFLFLCNQQELDNSTEAVQDAITLNRALVNQPYFNTDVQVNLKFNIIDFWHGITEGQPVALKKGNYVHEVKRTLQDYSDFQLWCKEVVWWGNKKGAYLYPLKSKETIEPVALVNALAGHY